MKAPYFVETLARNGDVLHRHQVDALPIRFGRGYDNDFILDDAFAAPRHAVLEAGEDGQAVLRDLGTKNGVVHLGKRATSLVLTGDTVIRIGHTTLRVRGADFPVGPEMVDRTMHGWEGAIPGIVGMLLIGAFALVTTWLSDTQAFQLIRYLLPLAFGIGAGLVWGGAWAFANRLFGRHARLGRHLFIFGCGLTAVLVYKLASSALAYAFSLEALTAYSAHVAIAIVAGAIFFHLGTVKPHQSRRFTLACLIMAMVGSGLVLISNQLRYGRVADELFMSVLMPPSARMSPDHTVDEFMTDVGAMKAGLDAQRGKKARGDGAGDDD